MKLLILKVNREERKKMSVLSGKEEVKLEEMTVVGICILNLHVIV